MFASNPATCRNRFVLLAVLLAMQSLALVATPVTGGAQAVAQDAEEEEVNKKRPLKGRKVQALSPAVNKIITQANELVDAKDMAGARREVDKAKALEGLKPYDVAQIYSFSGFLNFDAENYRGSMNDFNKVLQQPDLPDGLKQQAYRALAQLSFVQEDFDSAIRYAQGYLDEVGPDATMYIVIGQAYYEKSDYNRMIPPVEQAIKMTQEAGGDTREGWWQLLRVGYWEKKNYPKVREIMEVLVTNWPKKTYWLQLGAVYSELNDESRQLAAYEAAYDQGMLESSSELMTMGQLLMQSGAPYKGAKVIEKGLAEDKIEKTARNYRTLAQAWQMAQEDRRAIGPLNQAARLSDDGELYVRLAYSYLNLSEFDQCIEASNSAINKGGLKNKGDTYVVMGKCQFEKKRYGSAKTAFQNAARYDKTKQQAQNWLTYVANEQARLKQLEDSLKQLERANKAASERIESQGMPEATETT